MFVTGFQKATWNQRTQKRHPHLFHIQQLLCPLSKSIILIFVKTAFITNKHYLPMMTYYPYSQAFTSSSNSGSVANLTENLGMQSRVRRSRHKSMNGWLRNWEILKQVYWHDILVHSNVFGLSLSQHTLALKMVSHYLRLIQQQLNNNYNRRSDDNTRILVPLRRLVSK